MSVGKTLTVVACCLAAVGLRAGAAYADNAPHSGTGCSRVGLSVTANGTSPSTVRAVGAQGVESATIRLNGSTGLRGAFFEYVLGQARGAAANPPSFAWQLDGGGWQPGTLSTGFSGPSWAADPGDLGDLAPGSTHTLRFAVTFTAADQAGAYSGEVQVGSFSCGNLQVSAPLSISFAPPASPSASASASPSKSASASPSASASRSPSASPSPSPTPSLTPTDLPSPTLSGASATPVAAVKASASGGGGGTGSALALAAFVMLLGLLMAFVPGVVKHRRLRAETGEAGAGPVGRGEPMQ